MKSAKQNKQMWITLILAAVIVLAFCVTGIILSAQKCSTEDTPSPSETPGSEQQYETPIDFF